MLEKEFGEFYSAIKINDESDALIEKRKILENDIRDKFPKILDSHGIKINKSDIRIIDQGSYKYKTTIKSKIIDRDVAIIILIDINKYKDTRKLKKYLEEAIDIPSREVAIKEPCVRAVYREKGNEWMHIDLPLYAEYNDAYYLARGKRESSEYEWQIADPDGLNKYISDCLTKSDQLRRIICYIKKWKNEAYANSVRDHEIPPSIGLTLLACEYYSNVCHEENDDLNLLLLLMKEIAQRFKKSREYKLPVQPFSDVFCKMSNTYIENFSKKIYIAVENLEKACCSNNAHVAASYVAKVLGDEFPVPDDIDVIKTRECCFG